MIYPLRRGCFLRAFLRRTSHPIPHTGLFPTPTKLRTIPEKQLTPEVAPRGYVWSHTIDTKSALPRCFILGGAGFEVHFI